jgi:hypothetical protein
MQHHDILFYFSQRMPKGAAGNGGMGAEVVVYGVGLIVRQLYSGS